MTKIYDIKRLHVENKETETITHYTVGIDGLAGIRVEMREIYDSFSCRGDTSRREYIIKLYYANQDFIEILGDRIRLCHYTLRPPLKEPASKTA